MKEGKGREDVMAKKTKGRKEVQEGARGVRVAAEGYCKQPEGR